MITAFLLIFLVRHVYAAQSTITESEGYACLGDDKSKKQTEQAALTDAKKKAVEFVSTYIKSDTEVKNFELQKDLLSAYAHAEVKVIQEMNKAWYRDPSSGDCYKVNIKVEVIPDVKAMEKMATTNPSSGDESIAPLSVKLWTDKKEFRAGEKIKIYIKGNKPFYARVLYQNAIGEMLQLLPNPYRKDNYFNGNTLYEIPAGTDQFDLEVSSPFGAEDVVVYASTSILGKIAIETRGGVYKVKTQANDIGEITRGVEIVERNDNKASSSAEFYEDKVVVRTRR
jgi:hypothetical protein